MNRERKSAGKCGFGVAGKKMRGKKRGRTFWHAWLIPEATTTKREREKEDPQTQVKRDRTKERDCKDAQDEDDEKKKRKGDQRVCLSRSWRKRSR